MRNVLEHAPIGPREVEVRVAPDVGVDLGQVDAFSERQELAEDLGAAEDDHLGRVAGEGQRLIGRSRDAHAIPSELRVARQHDARAPRQGPADGFVCAATHDERLAQGQLANVLQVVGQAPGESAILADDLVAIERDDERDPTQTAIFALIGGWCW